MLFVPSGKISRVYSILDEKDTISRWSKALRAISLTINYEFCLLPRGALCSGLVQESTNNASFRFFALSSSVLRPKPTFAKKPE